MDHEPTDSDEQDRDADAHSLHYARETQWDPTADAKRVTIRVWLTPIVVLVVIAAITAAFAFIVRVTIPRVN